MKRDGRSSHTARQTTAPRYLRTRLHPGVLELSQTAETFRDVAAPASAGLRAMPFRFLFGRCHAVSVPDRVDSALAEVLIQGKVGLEADSLHVDVLGDAVRELELSDHRLDGADELTHGKGSAMLLLEVVHQPPRETQIHPRPASLVDSYLISLGLDLGVEPGHYGEQEAAQYDEERLHAFLPRPLGTIKGSWLPGALEYRS